LYKNGKVEEGYGQTVGKIRDFRKSGMNTGRKVPAWQRRGGGGGPKKEKEPAPNGRS